MTAQFTRNSPAWDENGIEYAAGVPIPALMLEVDDVTVEVDPTSGVGEDLAPLVGVDDRLFIARGKTSSDLYGSSDGETWTKLAVLGDLYQGIAYPYSPTRIDMIAVRDVVNRELWHIADIEGDATATRCQIGGGDASLPTADSAGGRLQEHGVNVRLDSSGNFVSLDLGYYANPNTPVATKLYRSTDGITLVESFDSGSPVTSANNHTHMILGDFAFLGDGPNRSMMRTTDAGESWSEVVSTNKKAQQPIGGSKVAGPDTTYLYGCDDPHGIAEFQWEGVIDGTATAPTIREADSGIPRFFRNDPSSGHHRYVWPVAQFGGAYLASHSPVAELDRSNIMLGDGNLSSWITFYHFGSGFRGVKYLTRIGETFIGSLENSTGGPNVRNLVRVKLPRRSYAKTTEIAPAATNLMSESDSIGGTVSNTSVPQAGISPSLGTGGVVGDNTIDATRTDAGNITMLFEEVSLTAGNNVCGLLYMKAMSTEISDFAVLDSGTSAADLDDTKAVGILSDNWIEIVLGVDGVADTGNHRLKAVHRADTADETKTMRFDRGGLFSASGLNCPPRWVKGGVTQAVEVLSETKFRGSSWSDTYRLWPMRDSEVIAGDVYLMTWKAGDSLISIKIERTGSDVRFVRETTINGVAQSDVVGAATYFYRKSQIDIAIELTASATNVTVSSGGTDFDLSNSDNLADLRSAAVE